MSSSATTAGVRTYQNFVNGKWESAASGKTFPVYDPSTEEVIADVAARRCCRRRSRSQSSACGFRFRPLAANHRARPRPHPLQARRKNSPKHRRACRTRMPQLWQAHRRSRIRHRRRRHLLRILRRTRQQSHRPRQSRPRQRPEPLLARTSGRRRPDHSLELSAAHGGLEACARARRRLYLRAEARRTNAADCSRIRKLV